ncbi:subtilisin-like protease-like protein, partial [Trifolium pratense]
DHISNINYPSIAISKFTGKEIVNVSRTVTNIGEEDETVYSAIVDAPNGVKVQLIPEKLQFTKSSKTIIGARYYADGDDDGSKTVRDNKGHGTHTASTAAGNVVNGASYYGLANGTAKGGSPESRLAIYKVCSATCSGSSILAAFDDAISDGVDVLSVSLGSSTELERDLTTDVIAIGSFHAVQHGILVVCSAGNDGPQPSSVTNDVPWILTVGATTIDRSLQSNIVLGNNK